MVMTFWIAAGAAVFVAVLYAMLCVASDSDDRSEKYWQDRRKR